jgi:hypothetical protein
LVSSLLKVYDNLAMNLSYNLKLKAQ